MRHAWVAAVALALIIASPHPTAGEEAPDQFVASWLSNITPFFGELIANMSLTQLSVVGEENLSFLGNRVTLNVTWVGEYETLSALVTFAGGYPARVIAVLEVRESAPWEPLSTMTEIYEDVTAYYQNLLKPYAPREGGGVGYYDRYWGATYPRVVGHPVYVALGEPAQVSVYLKRNDSGVIRLLIAEQLGVLRKDGPLPPRVGGFGLSESDVSEEFCGHVCKVEDIWLMSEEGLIPVYLVRSFSGSEGQILVVDAANGSVLFKDEWGNDEIVMVRPKPLTWRDVAIHAAVVAAIAPGAVALAWFVARSRMHSGKELPVKVEAALVVALLAGPIASIMISASAFPSGIEGDFCTHPPGGLYVASAEQVTPTSVSAVLGFSSGGNDFVVTKLVAWRGAWVSECVKCVFLIPRGSTGEVRVELGGMPTVLGGSLLISVYGYPGYEDRPYKQLYGRVSACAPS